MIPQPTRLAEQNRAAFRRLRRAILRDYSYWDLHSVDWKGRLATFRSRLCSARSAEEFAEQAANLLSVAKDIHLWLRVGQKIVATHRRCASLNIALASLLQLVPRWRQQSKIVFTGEYPEGIRYLCVRAWPYRAPREVEPAYKILREAYAAGHSLIIDVRANGGGSELVAARFAGCFIKRPVCYAKHLRQSGGRFTGPVERWLSPNKSRAHYSGRVAVRIGPAP